MIRGAVRGLPRVGWAINRLSREAGTSWETTSWGALPGAATGDPPWPNPGLNVAGAILGTTGGWSRCYLQR